MAGMTLQDIQNARLSQQDWNQMGSFAKKAVSDPNNPMNGAYLWAMRNKFAERVLIPEHQAREQAANLTQDQGVAAPGVAGMVSKLATVDPTDDPHMPDWAKLDEDSKRLLGKAAFHEKLNGSAIYGPVASEADLAEINGYGERSQEMFESKAAEGVSFTDARAAVDEALVKGLESRMDTSAAGAIKSLMKEFNTQSDDKKEEEEAKKSGKRGPGGPSPT